MDLPLDATRLLRPVDTPITVLTAGMDERKQALLRLAFKMHGALRYRLAADSPGAEPQLALVDIDGEGWPAWQRFRQAHPRLPAAIVTISAPEQAPAPILLKPLRMEKLFPLLSELRHAPSGAPRDWTPPPSASAPAAPPRAAPSRIERFDAANGLLGQACLLQRQGQDALILADGAPVLAIEGSQGLARLLCTEDRLRELCQEETIAIQPQTLAPLPQATTPRPLKPLLWQLAIWTSRGRLLRQIQADTALRLRYWPNLTRLAPIADACRISALLARTPVNLRLIARLLRVPPAKLFDFLAAAYCIGALEIRGEETLRIMSSAPIRRPPRPPAVAPAPESAGLLSRLLRKITGL